jgi:phage terminase small subunit
MRGRAVSTAWQAATNARAELGFAATEVLHHFDGVMILGGIGRDQPRDSARCTHPPRRAGALFTATHSNSFRRPIVPILPNARQEKFCQVRAKGKSAADAYEMAGYVGHRTNACRLARKPHIRARVAELMSKGAKRAEIDAEKVLRELAQIGFANMLDYVRIGPDGQPVIDLSRTTPEQAAAIAELRFGGIKFRLHDKRAALVDIGKHLGMFVERHEHAGRDGAPVEVSTVSDRDIAKAILLKLARAKSDADND